MYKYNIELVLAFLCCLSWKVQAIEENIKFCINTENTLLSEEHNTDNKGCGISATILTNNEKQMYQDVQCRDYGVPIDTYYYFKIYRGNLVGRGEDHDICNSTNDRLLAWIPYEQIKKYYGPKLNPKERQSYIAKAINKEDNNKTELCHFSHENLVYSNTDYRFACVLMVYEDNFFNLKNSINVLVEIEATMPASKGEL